MVVGLDKIELKDPDTHEPFIMRSPLYYVWLYPIEKVMGTNSNVPSTALAGKAGGKYSGTGTGGRVATSTSGPAGPSKQQSAAPGGGTRTIPGPKPTVRNVPSSATLILAPKTSAPQPGASSAAPAPTTTVPSAPSARPGASQSTQPGASAPQGTAPAAGATRTGATQAPQPGASTTTAPGNGRPRISAPSGAANP
jgi:hypothetical protein